LRPGEPSNRLDARAIQRLIASGGTVESERAPVVQFLAALDPSYISGPAFTYFCPSAESAGLAVLAAAVRRAETHCRTCICRRVALTEIRGHTLCTVITDLIAMAAPDSTSTRRHRTVLVSLLLTLGIGIVALPMVCGTATATASNGSVSDAVVTTTGNFTVSESVVASDDPDPASDRLGWENGVWANATLSVDQAGGIDQTELEAVVARTMARVESIRGLEFDRTPPVRVLLTDEQQSAVAGGLFEDGTFGQTERTLLNAQYEALFLINESRDAVESRRALSGAVNGYYRPATGNVTMVSPNSTVRQVREAILAQELFHAQQDTQFDLPDVETIEERNTRNSYVEGDANYVQTLYEQRCGSDWSGTCYRPDRTSIPDISDVNDGMEKLFRQPYESGYQFVSDRHQQLGWGAVDSLYENPPASTEQVIHPESDGEDEPTELRVTDRSTDAWQPLTVDGERVTGSVGEPGLYVSLLSPAFSSFRGGDIIPIENHQRDDPEGATYRYDHPTTAGWDGDRLVPYVATAGNATGYVSETAWDTPADAREFHGAYRKLLAYHGADRVPGLANTYRVPESSGFADAFYLNRTGGRLRIVNAPSVDGLSAVSQGAAPPSNASQPAVPWEQADLRWTVDPDGDSLSSSTVSDGTLYVQSGPANLTSIDGTTGEQLWTRQTDERIASSLAVSNGTVYAGTAGERVVAVDGATGDGRWTSQLDGVVTTELVVTGGTVYAGTAGGHLHALDAASGEQAWSSQVNGTVALGLAVADGTVLVASNSGLTAVDAATGAQTWRAGFDGPVVSPPTVSDGTAYIATPNPSTGATSLHALDALTGERQWTHETAQAGSRITVTGDTVYVGGTAAGSAGSPGADGPTSRLTALTSEAGDSRWTVALNGSLLAPPVVSNDTAYVGSTAGTIHAVATTSGERRWTVSTDDAVNPPLVVSNDTVYAGTQGGLLAAFDQATGDEQWRSFADGLAAVSPLPTVVDGTVYTEGATTLYAVDGPVSQQGSSDSPDDQDDSPDDQDDSPDDQDDSPDDQDDSPDDQDDSPDDQDGSTADGDGSGFGALVVAVALVAVTVVAWRHR
jgi:outer membrane protein assembly factor BamB